MSVHAMQSSHQAALKQINKFVSSNLHSLCKEVRSLMADRSSPVPNFVHLEQSLAKLGFGESSQRLAKDMVAEAAIKKVADLQG